MLAITGISGHTGRFFLNSLVENNYDGKIRCLIRTPDKIANLDWGNLDVEFVLGSLDDEKVIRSFLKDVDTVVHIANIHFSNKIIRIGKGCDVKRYILVHTTGIFSRFKEASSGYLEIEKQITPHMLKLGITIIRPTMIFGDMNDYNISKFIRFIDKCPILPIIDNGKALIQPVNARDLGIALYQVLQNDNSIGKAYNLSGERPVSIRELYSLIGKYLNKKRIVFSFPLGLCVQCARAICFFTKGKINLIEKVQRMGEDRSFSHLDAKVDFGYCPEAFEIGLRREVEQYLS